MEQKTTTVESALRLAKSHAAKGNVEKARYFYLMVLAKYPQNKKAKKGLKALQPEVVRESQTSVEQQKSDLIALCSAGKLNEALREAKRLSHANPMDPRLHNILGTICVRLEKLEEAVVSYERAVELKPDYADAHYNLGNSLRGLGQLDAAVTSCERALKLAKKDLNTLQDRNISANQPDLTEEKISDLIALYAAGKLNEALPEAKRLSRANPMDPLLHNILGAICAGLGKLEEAVVCYERAVELKPDYAEVHNNLGSVLRDLGQPDAAEASCRQALELKPDYAEAHNNLGNVLGDLGQPDAAVVSYERALGIKPDYAEAYYNLGNSFKNLGQLDTAVASYEQALEIKPDYAEVYYNLGNALRDLSQPDAAVMNYERALEIQQDYAEAHNNLGDVLRDLGHLDAAVASCKRALKIKPDYAEVHNNLGNALTYLGQRDAAEASYEQALRIKPNYAEAKWNLSLTQLLAGNYKEGWGNYEWRWKTKDFESESHHPQPFWDGSSLTDKTLILYSEQGVGDEVMFSSCIPDLIDRRPKQTILECDHRLKPLFARSFPQVKIQAKRTKENHDCFKEARNIDFQVAIGSLPGFLRPDLKSFSVTRPFLKPNLNLLDKWINRFAELGHGMKIGISWRGGIKEYSKKSRSTEFQLWESIFQSGAHFVNLQYGGCVEEINQLKKSMGIHIHDWPDADPLKDLDNFAAQIAALDLVISIDNSTVHFAGAMGTPVWILLPFAPDWRWLLGRDDSPWYPTARLFRQTTINDWEGVFNEVSQALKTFPMANKKDPSGFDVESNEKYS